MSRDRRIRARLRATLAIAAGALLGATAACASVPQGAVSDPDAPLVAFYGDSYTLGTGASSEDVRWSSVISRDRGWREFNPSVNGLGYVNNRGSLDLPGAIIAQEPDIVFVTMGLNDAFSFDFAAAEIHEAIDDDLGRLRDELPAARIVVVEPFWYTDERPQSIETIIGWVADAADDIGAEHIDGASHWIEGRPDLMAADGLHPNDDGYALMAERMDAELRALGL
jgi:lysophospholipase L1-like esterase